MIGIVVVSHSPRLAQAAVDLALEMVVGEKPSIAIAAGAGEGVTGTDAVRVSEAIAKVSSPDGVLVMMDLGSAVLSAEMALEFIKAGGPEVRLTSAPFVEGLLAGVVSAAGGATLAEVEREAFGALAAKRDQLGDTAVDAEVLPDLPAEASADLVLTNAHGLHARPAAMLIAALSGLDARVTLVNRRTDKQIVVSGATSLLLLGARNGDVLAASASGSQAALAIDAVRALVDDRFSESEPEAPGPRATRGGPLGVSPGRAVGPVVRMADALGEPTTSSPLPPKGREREAERIAAAASAVQTVLSDRAARATGEVRGVLEATALMAADPEFVASAKILVVSEGEHPERAVWRAMGAVAGQFSELGGLMAERVTDVRDIRDRIIAELAGIPSPGVPDRTEPFILVARDLAPADTALLDPRWCRALVTAEGGPTSHTAILARSLGLPAIVAAPGALEIPEGTIVIVDGDTGEIVVDPTKDQISELDRAREPITSFNGRGTTADGHRVELLANVASPATVAEAVESNAEGVGLFRTEFCFLDRAEAPSVGEQVTAYRGVLAAFPGKKVIVRTLDAGADKPLPFVTASEEENPALGIRGIRTSWRRPDLLNDQLRAIALASAAESAEVAVMAPMIATAEEAAEFARSCARNGLNTVGVMIEVPSAAITADRILAQVDFASLGTNDLAQYTMAADRLVGEVAGLNDPWQPAVLAMIQSACAAAQRAGKPIGVCGEAASDPNLAAVLVGLGATSLSMAPRSLGSVAAFLSTVTLDQCRAAAHAAAAAPDPVAGRAAAAGALRSS